MTERVELEQARAAKRRVIAIFAPLVGEEVAVGIVHLGEAGFGVKVNLDSEPDEDVEFPGEIDGVPVQVEVVGRIRKRGNG